VTWLICTRQRDVSRVKRFLKIKVNPAPQQHHTARTDQIANLAKVDLLYSTHALRKRGLFDNVEMTMPIVHSFDLGDIVTIFQMSPAKGLMIEGPATIIAKSMADEYYVVRFRSDVAEYSDILDCPNYERFVDRDGQEDPEAYRRRFNKKIGKPGR
jgi:hypothetical protein